MKFGLFYIVVIEKKLKIVNPNILFLMFMMFPFCASSRRASFTRYDIKKKIFYDQGQIIFSSLKIYHLVTKCVKEQYV